MKTGCLMTVGLFVAGYTLSWIITCGLIALVCLCFGWTFNWLIATGIWLVACIIRALFK